MRFPHHVFHQRVELLGDALVPASELAGLDPVRHAAAMSKYDDTPERRRLRETVIPGTGRTWTEAVHPRAIWEAWREVRGKELLRVEFWAVPASELPDGSVVLDRVSTAVGDPIDAAEVSPFEALTFTTADEVPPANRAWMAEMVRRGVSGAWFHGIPHVLVPGPVPLDRAQVFGWEEPA